MNGPQNHREAAATRYGVKRSTKPWMETVRLTMADQQSVFQYQLEELHRMYKREVDQMKAVEATLFGRSQRQLASIRKRVKKLKVELENETVNFSELVEVKVHVSKDINAPVTPETAISTVARGKEEEEVMSAAVALVDMSSSLDDRLLWFAKIVTSVWRNADVASMLKQTPRQHGKRLTEKKKKAGKKVKPCLPSWGRIEKGRRSKRVPAEDPMFTFERGALLTRWR